MEMKDSKLFSPLKVGRTVLQNRIGLAPMSMDYEAADGTVPKYDAALVDNAGNEIVAAGGASVEDGVITGTMNYYVAGVQEG